MGDFNAHHPSLSNENNRHGHFLAKALEENNLVPLNVEQPTRLNLTTTAANRWRVLDLVIVSSDIAHRCQSRVTEEFLGSDHRIVISEIHCMADIAENTFPQMAVQACQLGAISLFRP